MQKESGLGHFKKQVHNGIPKDILWKNVIMASRSAFLFKRIPHCVYDFIAGRGNIAIGADRLRLNSLKFKHFVQEIIMRKNYKAGEPLKFIQQRR